MDQWVAVDGIDEINRAGHKAVRWNVNLLVPRSQNKGGV